MATLSQLVETVAEVEGMEPATVNLIARNVREAGLITTGGRGLSAARMTMADAVNLLIAVNATVIVREAPQTLRTYRRLETVVQRTDVSVAKGYARSPRLPARTQLCHALEQLIKMVSNRTLPQLYLSTTVPDLIAQAVRKEDVQIEFKFFKPRPYSFLIISIDEEITVEGGLVPEDTSFDLLFKNATAIKFAFDLPTNQVKPYGKKHYGDRKDTTTIGYPTIRAIGELLRN
jgi:hypothetical protein